MRFIKYLKPNKTKVIISLIILIIGVIIFAYYNAFLTKCICLAEGCCSYEKKQQLFLSYFGGYNSRNLIFYTLYNIPIIVFYYLTHSYIEYKRKK